MPPKSQFRPLGSQNSTTEIDKKGQSSTLDTPSKKPDTLLKQLVSDALALPFIKHYLAIKDHWWVKGRRAKGRNEDAEKYEGYLEAINVHNSTGDYAAIGNITEEALQLIDGHPERSDLHNNMRTVFNKILRRTVHLLSSENHAVKSENRDLTARLSALESLVAAHQEQITRLTASSTTTTRTTDSALHKIETKGPQTSSPESPHSSHSSRTNSIASKDDRKRFSFPSFIPEFIEISEEDGRELLFGGKIEIIKAIIFKYNFAQVLDYRQDGMNALTSAGNKGWTKIKEMLIFLNEHILDLHQLIKSGDLKKVKQLLDDDKNHILINARNEETAINCAVGHQKFEIMMHFLMCKPSPNLESIGRDGFTVLGQYLNVCTSLQAVDGGKKRLEYLQALIKAGADVNAAGQDGRTPLLLACETDWLEGVRTLIQAKADVNIRADCYEASPTGERIKYHRSALDYAVLANSTTSSALIDELIAAKANINERDRYTGFTALHTAVSNGRKDAVASLLRHHAKVDLVDNQENTALHHAAKYNEKEILELLCSTPEGLAQVLRKNKRGKTPLELALKEQKKLQAKATKGDNEQAKKSAQYNETIATLKSLENLARLAVSIHQPETLHLESTDYQGSQAEFVRLKISQKNYLLRILSKQECHNLLSRDAQTRDDIENAITTLGANDAHLPFLSSFSIPITMVPSLLSLPVAGPMLEDRFSTIKENVTLGHYEKLDAKAPKDVGPLLNLKFCQSLRVQEEFVKSTTLAFDGFAKGDEKESGSTKKYWRYDNSNKTPSLVAGVFRELTLALETLHHAHEKGLNKNIVHRDLNSLNILVSHDETQKTTNIKLIDFDKAAFLDADGFIPAEITTQNYSSPDLLIAVHNETPTRGTADERYQLALLLYETLFEIRVPDHKDIIKALQELKYETPKKNTPQLFLYYMQYNTIRHQMMRDAYLKKMDSPLASDPTQKEIFKSAWELIERIITTIDPEKREKIDIINHTFLKTTPLPMAIDSASSNPIKTHASSESLSSATDVKSKSSITGLSINTDGYRQNNVFSQIQQPPPDQSCIVEAIEQIKVLVPSIKETLQDNVATINLIGATNHVLVKQALENMPKVSFNIEECPQSSSDEESLTFKISITPKTPSLELH